MAAAISECAALVRRHDRERFLITLFAPAAAREDLLALYAFNYEVAKTAETVSEPLIGQIRLQWWRDAIDGIYAGQPRAHPVAEALGASVTRHSLTRGHFERLIDGREADLAEEGPADMAALVAYAEVTSATLVWLALETLGVRSNDAEAAGRELGVAWALAGLLRALPFHARLRRLHLPRDRLDAAGISRTALFEQRETDRIKPIVREIAAEAERRLAKARHLARSLPRPALPALLPGVLARHHLRALRHADYDPWRLSPQPKRAGVPLRLSWAALLGRV